MATNQCEEQWIMSAEPAYLGTQNIVSGEHMPPDDAEPSAERQEALRASYEENVAAGRAPYADVRLFTRGELLWVLRERSWSTTYDHYQVKYGLTPSEADTQPAHLSGIVVKGVNLAGITLRRADLRSANLIGANLAGAHLVDANLAHAELGFANLSGALLV